MVTKWFLVSLATLLTGCTTMTASDDRMAGAGSTLSDRVKQLSRGTTWRPVTSIPAQFDTQHPQGMVKIGDSLFISSVEITTPTQRSRNPQGDYDRDPARALGTCTRST